MAAAMAATGSKPSGVLAEVWEAGWFTVGMRGCGVALRWGVSGCVFGVLGGVGFGVWVVEECVNRGRCRGYVLTRGGRFVVYRRVGCWLREGLVGGVLARVRLLGWREWGWFDEEEATMTMMTDERGIGGVCCLMLAGAEVVGEVGGEGVERSCPGGGVLDVGGFAFEAVSAAFADPVGVGFEDDDDEDEDEDFFFDDDDEDDDEESGEDDDFDDDEDDDEDFGDDDDDDEDL